MGATWGISRTMAEIHALLFIATEPLCTDDVMRALNVSRGNASMNLRQLLAWGLIRREHVRGDRKVYFASEGDVWEMFENISRERRRREVEPILEAIRRCRAMVDESLKGLDAVERKNARTYTKRLGDMLEFLTTINTLFNLASKAGKTGARKLLPVLSRIAR